MTRLNVEVGYEDALKFKRHPRNRVEIPGHVRNLELQWLRDPNLIPAITVNKRTNTIIDGNHRCKSYSNLSERGKINNKLPVMFVDIPEEEELAAIINANIHSKTWTSDDFINAFLPVNPSLQKLRDFCIEKKDFCIKRLKGTANYSYGAALAGISVHAFNKAARENTFEFTDEQLNLGRIVRPEIQQIIDVVSKKQNGWEIVKMCSAWHKVRNTYSIKSWVSELKKPKYRNYPIREVSDWDKLFGVALVSLSKKSQKGIAIVD